MGSASAAVQAEAGVHPGGGVGAAGVAAEGALVGPVDQGIAEIRPRHIGAAEAAAGGNHAAQHGIVEVGTAEIHLVHQHVAEVGAGEIGLRERRLGEDRPVQIGAGEAGTAALGAGEGGLGQVLAAEVLAVLVGEGVVHPLEFGPCRRNRSADQGAQGEHQAQQQGQAGGEGARAGHGASGVGVEKGPEPTPYGSTLAPGAAVVAVTLASIVARPGSHGGGAHP